MYDSREAKNLILISRFGPRSAPALALMEELQSQGVYVKALACDVTRKDSLTTMLSDYADTMPPIKGVIQGSMILRVCSKGMFKVLRYHAQLTTW